MKPATNRHGFTESEMQARADRLRSFPSVEAYETWQAERGVDGEIDDERNAEIGADLAETQAEIDKKYGVAFYDIDTGAGHLVELPEGMSYELADEQARIGTYGGQWKASDVYDVRTREVWQRYLNGEECEVCEGDVAPTFEVTVNVTDDQRFTLHCDQSILNIRTLVAHGNMKEAQEQIIALINGVYNARTYFPAVRSVIISEFVTVVRNAGRSLELIVPDERPEPATNQG